MSEHTKLFERRRPVRAARPSDGRSPEATRPESQEPAYRGGRRRDRGLRWVGLDRYERVVVRSHPDAGRSGRGGDRTGGDGQSGTGDFYSEDFSGLPPEGAVASNPDEGEVVADFAKIHVGFVYVYADGRVIWMRAATGSIYEQRLTPEGVDLVLSGDVKPPTFLDAWFGPDAVGLPAGAWADPTIRAYVPPRYAICYTDKDGNLVDPSSVVEFLLPSKPKPCSAARNGRTTISGDSAGASVLRLASR